MKLSKNVAGLLTSAVLFIVTQAILPAANAADLPAVGAKAPDLTLNSQEGTPVTLSQLRGKWVVLYFYPKDMTKGCTIEAHNFQRDLSQYQQKNTVVLGVSVDTVDSHQQFCTKESLTFKLLADPTHEVTTEYGSLGDYKGMVLANRNTFLIDPQGIIRKVYVKVNPEVHSQELLTALGELQKGSGE
jgi:peroxiredoxin Q/BCP